MKNSSRLICLGTLFCFNALLAAIDDDISVTDETWPRYPQYVDSSGLDDSDQECQLQLKAIILLGSYEPVTTAEVGNIKSGVHFIDVDVPGHKSQLSENLNTYLDQPLTTNTIDRITGDITQFYKEQGHPLLLVQVPEQDISDGVLYLITIESCMGSLCVQDNRYFSSSNLAKYVGVKPGQYIDEQTLVRNLNLINRNPFRHADFIYAPGTDFGTTDLILSVKDRSPWRFYTGYENTGVKATGRNRFYTGFNWGNVFDLSHIFGFQYTASDDFSSFQAWTGQYIAPFSWGHVFNVYGGYSSVNTTISDVMRSSGFASQISGRYIMPIFLTRYLLHDIILGFDWKRTNNTVIFGDDFPRPFGDNVNISQFVVGYTGDYDRTNFRIDFETNLFWSPGRLMSDQTDGDFQSLMPKAQNHWLYWNSSIAYLQKMPKDFSYFLKLEGQIASTNLLPSEEVGLGGWNSVRGYEQNVVNKDNAIIASTELRSPPIRIVSKHGRSPSDAFQILAFLDYAYGRNQFGFPQSGTTPSEPKNLWLMGIGPGLRYTLEPYFTARFDWGFKLHTGPFIGSRGNQVYFNLTASY